jgi:hypothetical protein
MGKGTQAALGSGPYREQLPANARSYSASGEHELRRHLGRDARNQPHPLRTETIFEKNRMILAAVQLDGVVLFPGAVTQKVRFTALLSAKRSYRAQEISGLFALSSR